MKITTKGDNTKQILEMMKKWINKVGNMKRDKIKILN